MRKDVQESIRMTNGAVYMEPASADDVKSVVRFMQKYVPESEESRENGRLLARQAQVLIEEHCTERLTLSVVASQLYVSPNYLSAILRQNLGRSFRNILYEARIRVAKEMMKNPAFRIFDIAYITGFSDVSHFSRVFKELEGVSAKEYRDHHLEPYTIECVWKLKKSLDF